MGSRSTVRKTTNLMRDPSLLAKARTFGVNLSQAAEAGLRHAVSEEKAAAWKQENAEALKGANSWVEEHGLPLAKQTA